MILLILAIFTVGAVVVGVPGAMVLVAGMAVLRFSLKFWWLWVIIAVICVASAAGGQG